MYFLIDLGMFSIQKNKERCTGKNDKGNKSLLYLEIQTRTPTHERGEAEESQFIFDAGND